MSRRSERGVALISVMVVVAAAVVLAVQMTTEQTLAVQRAGTFIRDQQAREYAYGGEELARQILAEDFRDTAGRDHLAEVWASPELDYEFEEGEIWIRIEDLAGRLNINSLRGNDPAAKARFTELSRDLGVDPMFVDRLVDWVDQNESKTGLGAEDYDYLGLERPYRSADQEIYDVSEMRLLLEMDRETYAKLAPYVAAIPTAESSININTASPLVLRAIAPRMTIDSAEALAQRRDEIDGYQRVEDFTQDPLVRGSLNANPAEDLGVQSNFFEVSVIAQYENRFAYLTSVIQRDNDGAMRVIYRDIGRKILPTVTESEDDAR